MAVTCLSSLTPSEHFQQFKRFLHNMSDQCSNLHSKTKPFLWILPFEPDGLSSHKCWGISQFQELGAHALTAKYVVIFVSNVLTKTAQFMMTMWYYMV